MIRDTLFLMRLNWVVSWNGFLATKWTRKLAMAGLSVGALALGAFSAFMGDGVAELISHSNQQFEALGPGLLLTGALIVLTFSSFGIALGALFLSGDIERLMAAPVSRRAIFTAKLLDGLWFYYVLLAVLVAPALLTYGLRLSYHPAYYVFCALTLLAAPLLGTGIGALGTMLAARFAPAQRVREVLTAVAGILGVLLSFAGQLPRFLFTSDSMGSMAANTEAFNHMLKQWSDAPLPTLWAGRGLVAAGHNDLRTGLAETAIYLTLTIGFFAFCVVVADKLYASGWARMQSSGVAHRKRRTRTAQANRAFPPELALAFKDWRFVLRDLRMLPRLLSPLIMIPFLYLSFFGPSGGRSGQRMDSMFSQFGLGNGLSGAILAGGVMYVCVILCSQLAMIGLSMEGRAYWVLKVAPITPGQLLRGKLLASLLPFVLISTLIFGFTATSQHRGLAWSLYGWLGILLVGTGLLAFSVGLSVPWARLDWDDPRRMTPGAGGCFTFIGYLIYGLPAGLALSLPLVVERAAPNVLAISFALALAMALLWTILFAGGALLWASRALPRLGEG